MKPITTAACVAFLILVVGAMPAHGHSPAPDVAQPPESFLERAFDGQVPQPQRVWVIGEIADVVRDILGHELRQFRIAYWTSGERTAWILEDDIGDAPMTIGVVVDSAHIEELEVLKYAAERGRDVTRPGFTAQFEGASLDPRGASLDREIRDVAGIGEPAQIMTALVRLALHLDSRMRSRGDASGGDAAAGLEIGRH